MKNIIAIIIVGAIAVCCATTFNKKEKIVFVTKETCENGKCITYGDAFMIEQACDDIKYYIELIQAHGRADKPMDFRKIENRVLEIEELIK